MNRVLFLDIDGVLNPFGATRLRPRDLLIGERLAKQYRNPCYRHISSVTLWRVMHGWDLEAIRLLRRLCDEFTLSIVISSSWGLFHSLAELKALFALHGLGERVADKVTYGGSRKDDIEQYLRAHPTITIWLALDDLPLPPHFPDHAIMTRRAFDRKDYEQARILLQKQEQAVSPLS